MESACTFNPDRPPGSDLAQKQLTRPINLRELVVHMSRPLRKAERLKRLPLLVFAHRTHCSTEVARLLIKRSCILCIAAHPAQDVASRTRLVFSPTACSAVSRGEGKTNFSNLLALFEHLTVAEICQGLLREIDNAPCRMAMACEAARRSLTSMGAAPPRRCSSRTALMVTAIPRIHDLWKCPPMSVGCGMKC